MIFILPIKLQGKETMPIYRKLKCLILYGILITVSLIISQVTNSQAGTVVVKPGQFDHFTLQIPDRLIAGENFIVRVQVYDANNNLITNFSETGKEFKVEIQGAATAQPSTLNAASFSGGAANVTVNSKKAEKLLFSLKESGGSVSVISRELLIVPNRLDHFVLQAPKTVIAGAHFDVRIIAKDLFENTVDDLNVGRNIKFNATGTSSVKIIGNSAVDFKNGMASATFLSEKVGNLIIELQEVSSGSRGRTQELAVLPAALSYFKMQAPRTGIAGDSLDLLIAAYDPYDNLVSNYASVGAGVRLSTTGTSKIEPSFVGPNEFRNGQATIKVTYEKAEDIQIVARENNREQSGKTADIQVANAAPEHFVVITPDSAVSGQKFKIKVEAYDRFNNPVKNFNLIGNDVMLGISGSGTITPSSILPAEFISGVAMVDVMYDKAESFQISARMAADHAPGKITVKEREVKRDAPQPREVPRTADKSVSALKPSGESVTPKKSTAVKESLQKKDAPPVKEAVTAQKSEAKPAKEAMQKREPVKKDSKQTEPKQKTITAKKPEVKREIPQKAVAVDAPKKAAAPKKDSLEKRTQAVTPGPVQKTTEARKTELAKKSPKAEKMELKEEKKPSAEPKQPVMELAKREEPKIDKPAVPHVFSVSNVSIIEAKNKAMLVINITNPNGHLEYSDMIESRYGKEWLKLKIKPAVRKSDKLYKFKSAFIGDVMVEEDKSGQDTLDIFIEMLPSGITFDIARIKNTLVVTLSQP